MIARIKGVLTVPRVVTTSIIQVIHVCAAAVVVVLNVNCGSNTQPASHATSTSPTTAAAVVAEPPSAPTPPPLVPWPPTKSGAAWSVIGWEMNDGEAEAALKQAGLTTNRRTEPASGRLEAVDVIGAKTGWKASVTFDKASGKVAAVVVKADSVPVDDAHDARARLEERFGAPKETRLHSSRQWETKAIEIEGNHQTAWRVTESLTRVGDAKSPVEWRTLKALTWGMSLTAARAAMKTAGFAPEKVAPPPPPPPAPPSQPIKPTGKSGAKKAAPPKPPKPMLPVTAPRGSKLIELTFRSGEEHVQISIIDKTGLYKVSVGQDVTDRKAAEKRARDASSGLGSCSSEAETESSVWRDTMVDARLSITGFQGQRIVNETYTNPTSSSEEPSTAQK